MSSARCTRRPDGSSGPPGDRRDHRRHLAPHLTPDRRLPPMEPRLGVPRRDGRGYGRGVKKRVPEWVAKVRGAAPRRWAAVREWRPDVRGWPWRARWLAHWVWRAWGGSGLAGHRIGYGCRSGGRTHLRPDWLTGSVSGGQPGSESRSTTIRNVGLIGGGAIAILIAYWRSRRMAQQDLLNKRYQEGAAMLGNDVLSVRLAGIYALERLAKDHPWEYHIEIMKSSARSCGIRPGLWRRGPRRCVREDVQAAMDAISRLPCSRS